MTQPNVNPSPKSRFLAGKSYVDKHRELIGNQNFQLGIDTALQQMLWLHSSGGEPAMSVVGNTAAEKFYRLQGAQEFVHVLKTLAETSVPLPVPDTGTIDHTFK